MRKVILAIFLAVAFHGVKSATITAISSGNWTNNARWDCSCQPADGDIIIIPNGIRVNVPFFTEIDLRGAGVTEIIIRSGGTLNFDLSAVRINNGDGDKITIEAGGTLEAIGGVYFEGEFFPSVVVGTDINGPEVIENGALPITLEAFEGRFEDGEIKLNWVTSNEEVFSHFELQRSHNGEDYNVIDEIYGTGGIETIAQYSHTDRNPLIGHNYYRLKAIDLDGSFEYSRAIHVLNPNTEKKISIYPNPVIDHFNVELNFKPSDGTVLIYNMRGEIIFETRVTEFANRISLEGSLDQGVYIIRYLEPGFHKTQRFIVR